jgi:O-methyltransferase
LSDQLKEMRERYLRLIARSLDGTIYEDPGLKANGDGKFNAELREHGWDWPSVAFTMVGTKRLANVRMVLESVLGEQVPGDFVETGVWRGGVCIMARAVLMAYGVTDRRVVVCDSFEGLPPPNADAYPLDQGSDFHTYPELAVSLDQVKANFSKYDLLDDQVVFLKGWFRDTMPMVPSQQIAVLRLDGDMYESTIDPLRHLYDRIPTGGFVVIDDYHVVPPCKKAVHDFLSERGIAVNLKEIDGVGVYFRKNEAEFLSRKSHGKRRWWTRSPN